MPFRDRREAGRRLAEKLTHLRAAHPVIVGLPRGGVPVAYEVARELSAPLDVIVVRKLGVPFQPELGFGAVGENGVRVLNDDIVRMTGLTTEEQARVEERERAEVERRARRFRGDRPPVPLSGRTVVVVDDGLATGGTARAALRVARAHGAGRIVLAVPVAPAETLAAMESDADEIVCLETPVPFFAIGAWYADFTQTSDEEVVGLLAVDPGAATVAGGATGTQPRAFVRDEEVEIAADVESPLSGHLTIPVDAIGLVVFAHGSGSSRFSSRNRSVARALQRAGLGTLLFDLLTDEEAMARANVFDVELLADRLAAATEWLREEPEGRHPIGLFGASTGAAAALWAAAEPAAPVRAVVSRGGRPDLAGSRLAAVRAPTLLIVGGRDQVVLDLNREAERMLGGERHLEVVPGATHLFEEPGALETVAGLACDWFARHLGAASV